MSSSDKSASPAHRRSARGAVLETTTRSVKRLLARQSVLVDAPQDPDTPADTQGVMLRLGACSRHCARE
jgi:hypothetical protein